MKSAENAVHETAISHVLFRDFGKGNEGENVMQQRCKVAESGSWSTSMWKQFHKFKIKPDICNKSPSYQSRLFSAIPCEYVKKYAIKARLYCL